MHEKDSGSVRWWMLALAPHGIPGDWLASRKVGMCDQKEQGTRAATMWLNSVLGDGVVLPQEPRKSLQGSRPATV